MKTPRELQREQKRRDYYRIRANDQKYLDRFDDFIFLATNNDLKYISPQSAARFVFLCSYLKYNTDRLYSTQRNPMTVDDLPSVLQVSPSTVRRFLEEVTPKYITVTEDGELQVNRSICRRSSLAKGEGSFHRVYTKLLRASYYSIPAERVKLLGYIFQAVRFLDTTTNMICTGYGGANPNVPMTGFRFAEAVKYNPRDIHRLRRYYEELTVELGTEIHKLMLFVPDSAPGRSPLYVNPCLMNSSKHPGLILASIPFISHKRGINWDMSQGDLPYYNGNQIQ